MSVRVRPPAPPSPNSQSHIRFFASRLSSEYTRAVLHSEYLLNMKLFRRHAVFTALVVAFVALTLIAQPKASSNDNAPTRELYALFDSEWQRTLKDNPTFASYLGDKRYNDRWDDRTLANLNQNDVLNKLALTRLKKIDRSQLSAADRVNYDLFQKDLETSIEQFQHRLFLAPVTQMGGIQTADEITELLSFSAVKDYEDWIARLNALPAYMDQTIELMRQGKTEGVVWSRLVLNRVPAQIDKQLVAAPENSSFYAPFKKMPASVAAADQARLQSAAKQAVTEKVIPAFQKLKKFFSEEYLPAAPAEAGIWQMKGGDKIYESLARMYTTTDLTPKAIHERGLSEVARIRAEMERIKTQVGFTGSLQEFFQFLRTDKRFYYQTPEELLAAYRATSKRIDPELTKLFKTLPRAPYGVIPIPDKIAPDTTTAYYNAPSADGKRAGSYYVNLYKPEVRPKYEMMALSVHEAVPGHHLQIALQQELGDMPNFRRYGGYTAFIEGWGLYSESLGDEMGLYTDPYDKFGQLTYEMWRAVRLVVDTGMHYFKWDRDKAIAYFRDNAAKTEQDIVNEIDRYISNPGQALAYKIGELKIKELRARATRELGEKFDIREFHDAVLLSGGVPLDVLERNINEWIAAKRK